jgi:hypothetical protein
VQVGGLALEGAQVELEVVSVAKKGVNPDGLGFVGLGAPITGTPLAVTCYASDDLGRVNSEMAGKYPSAAITVVQSQRAGGHMATACEAVVRGGSVKAEQIAFTGTRVGFGPVAVERLNRDLAEANAESTMIASHIYWVTAPPKISLPSASSVAVDGVASIDATFAVDAVAAVK